MTGGFQRGPIGGELAGIGAGAFFEAGAGVGFVVDQHSTLIRKQHEIDETRNTLT